MFKVSGYQVAHFAQQRRAGPATQERKRKNEFPNIVPQILDACCEERGIVRYFN